MRRGREGQEKGWGVRGAAAEWGAPCRPWGGGEAGTGGKMEGPAGRGEKGEAEVRARGGMENYRRYCFFFFHLLKSKAGAGWEAVSARNSDGGLQLCVSMQGAGVLGWWP